MYLLQLAFGLELSSGEGLYLWLWFLMPIAAIVVGLGLIWSYRGQLKKKKWVAALILVLLIWGLFQAWGHQEYFLDLIG